MEHHVWNSVSNVMGLGARNQERVETEVRRKSKTEPWIRRGEVASLTLKKGGSERNLKEWVICEVSPSLLRLVHTLSYHSFHELPLFQSPSN